MDDKNIYKIELNYINMGALNEDINKDSTYTAYIDHRQQYDSRNESIESFVKRRLEQYYEYYHNHKEKNNIWSTIEIMVYWDRKNTVAHEITTGTMIPLLVLNEQYDRLLPNGVKKYGDRIDLLFCNRYSKPSEFGYFGEINYYYVDRESSPKLKLDSSVSHLEELRNYIQEHSDHELFQRELNSIFEQSKVYMKDCVTTMINNIKNSQAEIEGKLRETSKEADQLLSSLPYTQVMEEQPIQKKKSIFDNLKK